jgi:hypothetical protein
VLAMLDEMETATDSGVLGEPGSLVFGSRLGPYEIINRIEGGMGRCASLPAPHGLTIGWP